MNALEDARRVRETAERLHSEQEVRTRIAALAEQAAARIADEHPVVLVVMTGGLFFAAELLRHFDFPYELDYVHVQRYGAAIEGGELEWIARPQSAVRGRTVLLVDDVLDRGVTISEIRRVLVAERPAQLLIAVLASKDVDIAERPAIDFVGFETPDRFLFGCGMDYKGFWRGLPALYAIA